MQKVWRVSQAIGDIAFAYPYSLILLEIQVTAAHPFRPELPKSTSNHVASVILNFCQQCTRTPSSLHQPRTRR